MSDQEERINEIEALKAIFFDEFEEIDPLNSYRIFLKASEQIQADESTTPSLYLNVEYTDNYPDEKPEILLEVVENLSDEEIDDLNLRLSESAQENIGMPMVFTLTSLIQEYLDDIGQIRTDKRKKEEEQKLLEEEKKENEKFIGTKVTPETFNEWCKKFYAARNMPKDKSERFNKPTGKELFESRKVNEKSDSAFLDEDDVAVDVSLFEKELSLEELNIEEDLVSDEDLDDSS